MRLGRANTVLSLVLVFLLALQPFALRTMSVQSAGDYRMAESELLREVSGAIGAIADAVIEVLSPGVAYAAGSERACSDARISAEPHWWEYWDSEIVFRLRQTAPDTYYEVRIRGDEYGWDYNTPIWSVEVRRVLAGVSTKLGATRSILPGAAYADKHEWAVTMVGDTIEVRIGDVLEVTRTDAAISGPGFWQVALGTETAFECLDLPSYDAGTHAIDFGDSQYADLSCSDCHSVDLLTEHERITSSSSGAECYTCHPAGTGEPGGWSGGCVGSGCHSVELHSGFAVNHVSVGVGETCAPCHPGTLDTIHASALVTIGADSFSSCSVCHRVDYLAGTADCTQCHFGLEGHYSAAAHLAAWSLDGCVGSGCHVSRDLAAEHAPRGLTCAACHTRPRSQDALSAGQTACDACHQGFSEAEGHSGGAGWEHWGSDARISAEPHWWEYWDSEIVFRLRQTAPDTYYEVRIRGDGFGWDYNTPIWSVEVRRVLAGVSTKLGATRSILPGAAYADKHEWAVTMVGDTIEVRIGDVLEVTRTDAAISGPGFWQAALGTETAFECLDAPGTPENTPPQAFSDSYETSQDTTLNVPVPGVLENDLDDDGDPLTADLVTPPAYGEALLAPDGSLTYVPLAGWSGTDTLMYRAFDGQAHSQPATITVTVVEAEAEPDSIIVSGMIGEDETWTSARVYVLAGAVVVPDDVTLSIQAGAIVKGLDTSSMLVVRGTLVSQGTDAAPVVFTSFKDDAQGGDTNGDSVETSPAAGDWAGIRLEGSAAGTALTRTSIMHAGTWQSSPWIAESAVLIEDCSPTLDACEIRWVLGGGIEIMGAEAEPHITRLLVSEVGNGSGITYMGGAGGVLEYSLLVDCAYDSVDVFGTSAPVIRDNRFENSGWSGVYGDSWGEEGEASFAVIQRNEFAGYGWFPICMYQDCTFEFEDNEFEGDAWNAIAVGADRLTSAPLHLADHGVPYVVDWDWYVGPEAHISVEAGVVVKFLSGGWGPVSVTVDGQLDVSGAQQAPVVFTSFADDAYGGDTAGDDDASVPSEYPWYLEFREDSAASAENAQIRYGGASHEEDALPALLLSGGAVTIDQVAFTQCSGYPLEVAGDSTPVLGSITVTECGTNGVLLSGPRDRTAWTAPDTGVPYVIAEDYVIGDDGGLGVGAGVIIKLDDAQLIVDGVLDCAGSAAAPVVLTSIRDDAQGGDTNRDGAATTPEYDAASPHRLGLVLRGSSQAQLSHTEIWYGADTRLGGHEAAISILDSSPLIKDCLVSHAHTYGIKVTGGAAAPTIEGSTIAECGNLGQWVDWAGAYLGAGAGVLFEDHAAGSLIDCSIEDNVGSGVVVRTSSCPQIVDNLFHGNALSGPGAECTEFALKLGEYWDAGGSQASRAMVDGNRFIDNGSYPIVMAMHAEPEIDPQGNVFSGNIGDGVLLYGRLRDHDKVLQKLNVPYIVDNYCPQVEAGAGLTIQPGVIVKFAQGAGRNLPSLSLMDGAYFVAEGTSSEPIIFTSITDDRFGGPTRGGYYYGDEGGMLQLGSRAWYDHMRDQRVSLQHVQFYRGSPNGWPLLMLSSPLGSIRDCLFAGSRGDGVEVYWNSRAAGVPTEVEFERTRFVDNAWAGISWYDRPAGVMTDCTVEGNVQNGIYMWGARPTITGTKIRENTGNGVTISGASWQPGDPLISDCTITSNGGSGVYSESRGTVLSSTISGNGSHGVHSRGQSLLVTKSAIRTNGGWHAFNEGGQLMLRWVDMFGGSSQKVSRVAGASRLDAGFCYWGSRSGPSDEDAAAADVIPPSSIPCRDGKGAFGYGFDTPCGRWGDPVNTATGNFYHTEVDISLPGLGLPLEFRRTYNSQDAGDNNSDLGHGWAHTLGVALRFDNDEAVTLIHKDGRRLTFTPDGDGGYASPSGITETLQSAGDGTWELRHLDSSVYRFDSNGRLAEQTDRFGNATVFTYAKPTSSLVSTVTAPGGRSLTFEYTDGRIAEITDNAGRSVSYAYDSAGNLTHVTGVTGEVTEFSYDDAHQMLTITYPEYPETPFLVNEYVDGKVVVQHDGYGSTGTLEFDEGERTTSIVNNRGLTQIHAWDELFRLTAETDGAGYTSTRSYNGAGLLESVTDANNHTTSFTYDANGNRTRVTDAAGHTSRAQYDLANNNILWSEDAEGVRTTYTYDASGTFLERVTNPVFEVTYCHTPSGLVSSTTIGGATTSFGYDAAGRLTSVTDPLGTETTMTYDTAGNMTSITDALGRTVRFTYDAAGRVLTATDPAGEMASFGYDANGNRTSATDQLGKTTHFTYDVMSKLSSVTDPLSNTWTYTYDPNYNLASVTNPRGATTSYTYTANDRLEATTDALGHTWAFTHDGAGNTLSSVYPTGEAVSRTYAADDLLATSTYSTGERYTFAYTPTHRLASVTDHAGRAQAFAYNPAGWLTRAEDTAGGTAFATTYGYDAAGRVTSLASDAAPELTYAYDLAGRLTSLTSSGATATFTHDAAGARTGVTLPSGALTAYGYDPAGRIESIVTTASTGVIAERYTRDAAGRVTSDSSGTYAYDDAGRLVSWTAPGGSVTTYTYDAASNLTGVSVDGSATVGFTVDAADRITSPGFTYDDAGNLTCDGKRLFTYDAACRLTSVKDAATGATIASYTYDAFNRRVSATEGTATVFFHYDGASARVIAETDGSGTTIATYAYDSSGTLFSMTRDGATYYYHLNARGDVVAMTDATGAVVNTYAYDPWGQLLSATETVLNPYRYASYRYDTSTGLYYCWNRYYAPELARFLTRDIYPGELSDPVTMNPYLYCGGDPVNYVDPSGLWNVTNTALVLNSVAAVAGTVALAATIATVTTGWTGVGAVAGGTIALWATGIAAAATLGSLACTELAYKDRLISRERRDLERGLAVTSLALGLTGQAPGAIALQVLGRSCSVASMGMSAADNLATIGN